MPYSSNRGVRIYYGVYGEGPPMVLVHANPFDHPGTPAERVAALRTAFDETLRDPAFLQEAQNSRLEISPLSGADIAGLVAKLYGAPTEVIAAAKATTE